MIKEVEKESGSKFKKLFNEKQQKEIEQMIKDLDMKINNSCKEV